jgi:hypothetical protein
VDVDGFEVSKFPIANAQLSILILTELEIGKWELAIVSAP